MSKDAYYFSHDSNARNDQRLMKVRMQYGIRGYGIYFAVVEILRDNQDYTLNVNDISSIAFDLRDDVDVISDIILNYDLFVVEDDVFYSKSLKRRMLALDQKRDRLIEAGRKGGLNSAKARLKHKSKVNKNKLDKNKVNDINKRMLLFKESLEKHSNQYNKDTIENFFNYWSEPNKSNTKMKFEQQTTWDISRRLKRWASYDFGNSKSNGVKPKINFRQPDGKNYIAYCSKCNNSDFYEPFNFKPELIESKCCNAEILNERRVDVKSI